MRRVFAGTVTALIVVLVVAGCSTSQKTVGATASSVPVPTPTPVSTAATTVDGQFAVDMLQHHQQGVQIDQLLLAKGTSIPATVRAFATTAIQERTPQIEAITRWTQSHASLLPAEASPSGMASGDELVDLTQATGPAASQLFLTQMIAHHKGAVDMARREEAAGSDPEMLQLAGDLITTELSELNQMQAVLTPQG